MCFASAPAPQAPPPPSPIPDPLKDTDPQVKKAKGKARRTAALAQGRQSTLLGGQLTSDPLNQPRKTLLGA